MTDVYELKLKEIAEHYGLIHQSIKAIEEMAELAQALAKQYTRLCEGKHTKYDDVLEEIADVEIMLDQLKYLISISERDLDEAKKKKIDRQIIRMRGRM